ncbi:DNA (cytosine-5)-methyltransferase CMT3 [Citrus sinensis]|uniref:DNA (cytosine-5-)-methyltransferase n=4 Tax=Citrus TaxID=2706 RepID=T1WH19_CITSI|nr:DNA (cytosine-5)-methyltransferase CMT3-like [Citrus sinensis]AGU16982.1 CMT-type DNA-methyltransferase [Citrus sinensis]KAH9740806.1 DNA (cytosine-5)-methyltransferase CMT3 [Citrus sinensis]KAH9789316.1 DNA (cytosine-5)-methyltransferase CMT3 [Citrus sinensis]
MPTKRKTRSSVNDNTSLSSKKSKVEPEPEACVEKEGEVAEVICENSVAGSGSSSGVKVNKNRSSSKKPIDSVKKLPVRGEHDDDDEPEARFLGDPVPDGEARQRWPKRYEVKKQKRRNQKDDDEEEIIQAKCHYMWAEVDGHITYDLFDDAHVKAESGEEDYICKIVEMFEAVDGTPYFTAQWYYRARDTVIESNAHLIDQRRVFFSEIQNDNPLECLVKKLNIARVPLNIDLEAKKLAIPHCDYYCDMMYLLPYSTFFSLPPENKRVSSETSSTISSDVDANECEVGEPQKMDVKLLDLYSGCGAMSTGLCLGANLAGLNLVTRWAVDINEYACQSLKLNHPETEVRNESAEDFLTLLREWEKLCISFSLIARKDPQQQLYSFNDDGESEEDDDNGNVEDESEDDSEIFEVEKILKICYGDPKEIKKRGLYLKVRWRNYGPSEDTWEPIEGLSNCGEKIKEFVTHGFKSKILPLPGDVDVICGGPPCQGVSGFNRFRNKDNPLADEKNKQLIVFMDIVDFLKPKFVLMENVVDIVKFAKGLLGRYALARLIQMNYQVRMGMMAAGAYGLPQFRMRVFLWGAQPTEKLPPYALPTHDVVLRGVIPTEFERNTVAYDEGQQAELARKLLLQDAISDLPSVDNYESRDEIPYDREPETEFQCFIRLRKDEMMGSSSESKPREQMLYDHRPLELNKDDYQRVCRVPKKKGANFRDFPGVRVRPDNKVEWDPNVERIYLESGKPLVPNYAMSFIDGTSSKPFARLWWDETVPTVVTRAEPHNQAILHPVQDRVLTVRENARLQGFPDYYKLCGPIKERYIQVGNAVAVPVSRALGYALGLTMQGSTTNEPLFTLPRGFPNILDQVAPVSSEDA